MTWQIITSPKGERMVILPETDYLALRDAAASKLDGDAIKRFEASLLEGTEELLPASLVNAILDGANPVRVWRKYRGLSAKALANQAGLAPAYLSQIETGKRDGTLETYRRIAEALNLTLDDLVG